MAREFVFLEYRSAIALNNIGVSLLERQAYRQAMDTLKDAIFVMKFALRPRTSTPQLGTSLDYHKRLESAFRRIANPQPVPTCVHLNFVVHDGCLQYKTMRTVLHQGIMSQVTLPVRVDAVEFDTLDERDPELESAIVIYNFAIAHLCLAKLSKTKTSREKLLEGAYKLFNMSYAVVCDEGKLCRLSEQDFSELTESRLVMAVAVLKNIVQILVELGKILEAKDCYQKLLRLEMAAFSMAEPTLGNSLDTAAAAA